MGWDEADVEQSLKTANKKRGTLRAVFTRQYQDLVTRIEGGECSVNEISAKFTLFETKHYEIVAANQAIVDLLYKMESDDERIIHEMETADEYSYKFQFLKSRIETLCSDVKSKSGDNETVVLGSDRKHSFRLPKLELIKFSGEISQWTGFWAQFSCIDSDPNLSNHEKFQYLLQAMVPGSRARTFLDSFPPSSENYSKAIEALKDRFGRKDLLVEYYIRELLKLVSGHGKMELSLLFDKLSAQLNSLETLGIISDNYAAILFPLVESCLPVETLRVWQRSNSDCSLSLKQQMDNLMKFVKAEVEAEERVDLACPKLTPVRYKGTERPETLQKTERCPTAAGLSNLSLNDPCIFCEGTHTPTDCQNAAKMSLDEKRTIISRAGRCFTCAQKGHVAMRCRARCAVCKGRHIELLCNRKSSSFCSGDNTKPHVLSETDLLAVNHSLTVSSTNEVFLQTFAVLLHNGSEQRKIRALIDNGSQRSYILGSLAKEMKYSAIGEETLIHSLFGGCNLGLVKHVCYKARLQSLYGDFACRFSVLDQKTIASFIPIVSPDSSVTQELEKEGIKLIEDVHGPIDILIGADVAGKIWTGKTHILSSGFVAIETMFGWTLMGTRRKPIEARCSTNLATTFTMASMSAADVADLWKLETIGICDPIETEKREAKRLAALDHFKKTVAYVDGRYQVRLPWYNIVQDLPSNRGLAENQLVRGTKKMLHNEKLYQEYDAVFKEWLRLEIIEKAEDSDRGHYLPHRPVVKEASSTMTVRPVFNASARVTGYPSLNDCLEQGPNLIELLPNNLLRFREKAIGVSGDIEKAFLQISVHPDDREYLKFLWWTEEEKPEVLQHARVVFGVTCSPFLLAAVIDHHLDVCRQNAPPDVQQIIMKLGRCFYVDNLATSVDTLSKAEELKGVATEVMAKGGFNLRDWEFSFDKTERPSSILGLKWNRNADTLSLNMQWWEETPSAGALTKRKVLSMTQRIFDPIGFSGPAIMELKLMLQTLWEKKIDWDDALDEETSKCFYGWLQQVHLLQGIAVQRNLGTVVNRSLHLFTDVSSKAYAACIFVRSETTDGRVIVSLVQAKARVAPSKTATMPRLELMGATIGARLLRSVQDALNWRTVPVFAWSDSSTVIAWIDRQEEWTVFVRNRVKEVRQLMPGVVWRHIPGPLNPADLPSRGCSVEQLVMSRWWEGPAWLYEKEENWPASHISYSEEEVLGERMRQSVVLLNTPIDHGWLYQFFAGYERIIRLVGWMQRFHFNSSPRLNCGQKRNGALSVDELMHAEKTVLQLVQEEAFQGVEDDRICKLNPFMDADGLLRVKTRLTERDDQASFTMPVILPCDHPVVRRLVHYHHLKAKHVGAHTLWAILREDYWILKGHQVTRNVVRRCVTCRRYSSKNLDVQSPPLPGTRINDASVFEVCGVDYAGPLILRNGSKVWIALFSCGVYRAVHLELVTSLSTDSFLLAFRRFMARRGRPRVIYSDNATCFRGADILFDLLDWDKIREYASVERIQWRFNPPTALWWGGFFERMIQSVKKLLRRILGKAALDCEELYTVLCECEDLINSRPLTSCSGVPDDPAPLTPASFLKDLQHGGAADCDAIEESSLDRRLQYRQNLRAQLQERFRTEYLGNLRWLHRQTTREPVVGEVVLVGSDDTRRMDWPLGRVEEVLPGPDGRSRVIRVRTVKGTLTRPLQRIFPLEIGSTVVQPEYSGPGDVSAVLPSALPEQDDNPEMDIPDTCPENLRTRCGRSVRAPHRLDL